MQIEENRNRELVEQMIKNLKRRIATELPDKGDFKMIYEIVDNKDCNLFNITKISLRVKSLPKGLENWETFRSLDLALYNGSPYMSSWTVIYGDKQKILDKLSDPATVDVILDKLPLLARDLNAN